MYKVNFEIDNSSGIAFSREEKFFVTSTGRYTIRKNDEFISSTQHSEGLEVKSNRPFVVTVTGSYYQEGFNGHSGRKEKYVRIYQPECLEWVK
jgi:galactose mutarotase-like enzyme